jgi:hypothetical protein
MTVKAHEFPGLGLKLDPKEGADPGASGIVLHLHITHVLVIIVIGLICLKPMKDTYRIKEAQFKGGVNHDPFGNGKGDDTKKPEMEVVHILVFIDLMLHDLSAVFDIGRIKSKLGIVYSFRIL